MKLLDVIGQGGLSGTRLADYLRHDQEVLDYIAQNGPCSRFDIEMELNHSSKGAIGHLAGLLGQGKIERTGNKYRSIPQ